MTLQSRHIYDSISSNSFDTRFSSKHFQFLISLQRFCLCLPRPSSLAIIHVKEINVDLYYGDGEYKLHIHACICIHMHMTSNCYYEFQVINSIHIL